MKDIARRFANQGYVALAVDWLMSRCGAYEKKQVQRLLLLAALAYLIAAIAVEAISMMVKLAAQKLIHPAVPPTNTRHHSFLLIIPNRMAPLVPSGNIIEFATIDDVQDTTAEEAYGNSEHPCNRQSSKKVFFPEDKKLRHTPGSEIECHCRKYEQRDSC